MPPIDQHVPWSRSGNKEDDQEGLGNTSKKSTGEDGRDEGLEIVVWRSVDCWLADCGVLPAMRSRRRWRRTGRLGRDELPIKMQSCCFYHVVLILLTMIFVENICTMVWLRYRATIFILHYLVGLIIWIKYKASVVQKFLVTFVYLYCLVSN